MSFTGGTSGTTATNLFTTPAGPKAGRFIVTQFCAWQETTGLRLKGSNLGDIAHIAGQDSEEKCIAFNPGVALSQNETIFCQSPSSGTGHCMITGVLSKR